MSKEKLSTNVLDKLRFVGWKEYVGDEPSLLDFWVKDGRGIKIVPARRINGMFLVSLVSPNVNESRFVSLTDLMGLIGD
jgi:hypothetical protein